jgi:hypothetical protein
LKRQKIPIHAQDYHLYHGCKFGSAGQSLGFVAKGSNAGGARLNIFVLSKEGKVGNDGHCS